jgi:hypothetical protein
MCMCVCTHAKVFSELCCCPDYQNRFHSSLTVNVYLCGWSTQETGCNCFVEQIEYVEMTTTPSQTLPVHLRRHMTLRDQISITEMV